MAERSKKRQFAINLVATFTTFFVGLGIRFFLTPFVVKNLGADAYGFIGLSTNILSYTALITIALNSMASRFVTISYSSGRIDEANRYYTSVFFANFILAALILVFAIACVGYMEFIIDVPKHLLFDVKILFCLLALNNVIALITGIWNVSTFIKNRLDLSNVRSIIGNILNACTLFFLFSFFTPHIWYVGAAGIVLTVYTSIANRTFVKRLTPDLVVSPQKFEWTKIVELSKSGVWNVFNKLGEIIGSGLDLILANLFISANAMGIFSLTKTIPIMLCSLFAMLSGVFAPSFTILFAQKKFFELKKSMLQSVRVLGFFNVIPMVCLISFGENFYHLWLPSQDSHLLQVLTILGCFGIIFSMPLEGLWNIFTVTNKLKYSTIFIFFQHLLSFFIVFAAMLWVDDPLKKLYILAGTRSFIGLIKSLLFLPIYGARCLNYEKTFFYPAILKSVLCFGISISFALILKMFFNPNSWLELFLVWGICGIICVVVNYWIILTDDDKIFFKNKIAKRMHG